MDSRMDLYKIMEQIGRGAFGAAILVHHKAEKKKPSYLISKNQGRNEFVIRLQPPEAMYMKLTVKMPGLDMSTVQSELDLSYRQRYQGVRIPEAYERLFLDTIRGDQQHFVRRDELKVAWEIFTPFFTKSTGER